MSSAPAADTHSAAVTGAGTLWAKVGQSAER